MMSLRRCLVTTFAAAAVMIAADRVASSAPLPVILDHSAGPSVRGSGRAPESMRVRLAIVLSYRHSAELDSLVYAQSDVKSPLFRRYLAPRQFAAYFSPSSAAYTSVITSLSANGFSVEKVYANRTVIDASATVGNVERFFSTEVRLLGHGSPVDDYVNDRPISIPPAVRGLIAGVAGLEGIGHMQSDFTSPLGLAANYQAAKTGNREDSGLKPYSLATAYGIAPPAPGQRVPEATAIVANADFLDSDVADYVSRFGVVGGTRTFPIRSIVNGGPGLPATVDAMQTTFDVEMLMGTSGSAPHVYEIPSYRRDADILDAYEQILSDDAVAAVASDFGGCENSFHDNFPLLADRLALQGSSLGITFYAPSGNATAVSARCKNGVDAPASAPHFIAVGGSELVLEKSSKARVTGEGPWHDLTGASAGGVSQIFATPWYQARLSGVIATGRNVPDLAFAAAGRDGATFIFKGNLQRAAGGTALASAVFGAALADINRRNAGRSGFINPLVYWNALHLNDKTATRDFVVQSIITLNRNPYDAIFGTGLGTLRLVRVNVGKPTRNKVPKHEAITKQHTASGQGNMKARISDYVANSFAVYANSCQNDVYSLSNSGVYNASLVGGTVNVPAPAPSTTPGVNPYPGGSYVYPTYGIFGVSNRGHVRDGAIGSVGCAGRTPDWRAYYKNLGAKKGIGHIVSTLPCSSVNDIAGEIAMEPYIETVLGTVEPEGGQYTGILTGDTGNVAPANSQDLSIRFGDMLFRGESYTINDGDVNSETITIDPAIACRKSPSTMTHFSAPTKYQHKESWGLLTRGNGNAKNPPALVPIGSTQVDIDFSKGNRVAPSANDWITFGCDYTVKVSEGNQKVGFNQKTLYPHESFKIRDVQNVTTNTETVDLSDASGAPAATKYAYGPIDGMSTSATLGSAYAAESCVTANNDVWHEITVSQPSLFTAVQAGNARKPPAMPGDAPVPKTIVGGTNYENLATIMNFSPAQADIIYNNIDVVGTDWDSVNFNPEVPNGNGQIPNPGCDQTSTSGISLAARFACYQTLTARQGSTRGVIFPATEICQGIPTGMGQFLTGSGFHPPETQLADCFNGLLINHEYLENAGYPHGVSVVASMIGGAYGCGRGFFGEELINNFCSGGPDNLLGSPEGPGVPLPVFYTIREFEQLYSDPTCRVSSCRFVPGAFTGRFVYNGSTNGTGVPGIVTACNTPTALTASLEDFNCTFHEKSDGSAILAIWSGHSRWNTDFANSKTEDGQGKMVGISGACATHASNCDTYYNRQVLLDVNDANFANGSPTIRHLDADIDDSAFSGATCPGPKCGSHKNAEVALRNYATPQMLECPLTPGSIGYGTDFFGCLTQKVAMVPTGKITGGYDQYKLVLSNYDTIVIEFKLPKPA